MCFLALLPDLQVELHARNKLNVWIHSTDLWTISCLIQQPYIIKKRLQRRIKQNPFFTLQNCI